MLTVPVSKGNAFLVLIHCSDFALRAPLTFEIRFNGFFELFSTALGALRAQNRISEFFNVDPILSTFYSGACAAPLSIERKCLSSSNALVRFFSEITVYFRKSIEWIFLKLSSAP